MTAFPPFTGLPRILKNAHGLFADLTVPAHVYLTKLASANPFIYSTICAPSPVSAEPLLQQLQEST